MDHVERVAFLPMLDISSVREIDLLVLRNAAAPVPRSVKPAQHRFCPEMLQSVVCPEQARKWARACDPPHTRLWPADCPVCRGECLVLTVKQETRMMSLVTVSTRFFIFMLCTR